MTVEYTTVDRVGNVLGYPDGFFTISTTPTISVIEDFINESEDSIDTDTGHAWREKTVLNEYLKPDSNYHYGTGITFNLKNRSIRSMDSIEIWDGNNWIDWVATKTEGRNKDYWVDETNGVLYVVTLCSLFDSGIRVNYKYGETVVPKSIRRAASYMAAIELLNAPEFSVVTFTEGGIGTTRTVDKIAIWQKTVDKIINNNSEFKV